MNAFNKKCFIPLHSHMDVYSSLITDVTADFVRCETDFTHSTITISIKVGRLLNLSSIQIYFLREGDEVRLNLNKKAEAEFSLWSVSFKMHNNLLNDGLSYRFKISEKNRCLFLDAEGLYKYKVSNSSNFKYFPFGSSPAWLDAAIIYHIFVDRFSLSKKNINLGKEYVDVEPGEVKEYFKGDLYGVLEKIDYLVDLGVNAICLSPIFSASTNHRYDVEDYYSIDDVLGGEEAFRKLCIACRKVNIKILLDGVFNHTSAKNSWFDIHGLAEIPGAFQDVASPYFGFYNFSQHPKVYEAFWDEKNLPKLNYTSQELREHIYRKNDSVIKYWMKPPYGIDGWRLDASCMIGMIDGINLNSEVLSELYLESKKEKPDSYIFGENPFDPAMVKQYLQLDGITNYSGFYTPLVMWLSCEFDFDAKDFDIALTEFRALVGLQFLMSSKNFIGNHDKQRFINLVGFDLSKYFTALTFLFTYPGTPSLYYGEEIGIYNDSLLDDSRMAMQWESWSFKNFKIHKYVKQLIEFYRSSVALQHGGYRTISAEENIFIFERRTSTNLVIVILTNSTYANDIIEFKVDMLCGYPSLKALRILVGDVVELIDRECGVFNLKVGDPTLPIILST